MKNNHIIRKAKTLIITHYAHMMEYRAEILLWILAGSLPLILMGVWIEASQQTNFGLNSVDFARYFFTVFLVRQFSTVWVIWEFEREILEGRLSLRLLQPLDPGWHHFSMHVSEKITRFPLSLLLAVFFFWLYPQAFWVPTWSNLLLGILVVILGFILRFLVQYTFAMCAFWTERASALEQFWFLFYIFLSGLIAPLEVFPPEFRAFVSWTPFPYFLHFPAALLIGLPVDVGKSLAVMIAWGIFFYWLNRRLWRLGLKRYSGMGA